MDPQKPSDDLDVDPTILKPVTAAVPDGTAAFDDLDFEQTILRTRAGAQVFGRYTLRRELGRGGMGIVWLARDETLETEVALKFLPDNVARDPEAIAGLKRETLRSRELRHPGIVGVYEFAQDSRSASIVMEYIDGATLSELKTEQPGGCFDVPDIAPWIEQLCTVLAYAHDHARVAHRDLKPRNLMLGAAGRLKVADFGIARSVSDSLSLVSKRAHSSGTPPYMSPQQDNGETPSASDDIYALGATIYDLLTSKPPFYTGNISRQIHEKIPPRMAEQRSKLGVQGKAVIPEQWERFVAACLAKKPEGRPGSATECLEWIGGNSTSTARTSRFSRPATAVASRRRLIALGATIVLGTSGFALWRSNLLSPARQRQVEPTTALTPAPVTASDATSQPQPTAPAVAIAEPSPALNSAKAPASNPTLETPSPSSLETAANTNVTPPTMTVSSPSAATTPSSSPAPDSNSPPTKPTVAKKKAASSESSPGSTRSRSNASPERRAIEAQYRKGFLTREQYLNALKNL